LRLVATAGPGTLAGLAALVLLSTTLPYLLYAYGASRIEPKRAMALQWVQPVAAESVSALLTSRLPGAVSLCSMVLLTLTLARGGSAADPPDTCTADRA
jgi:drug/metabolite transporter (DMT)-like permease